MSEIERIVNLLERTFAGKPYYGPPLLGTLEKVDAELATRKPRGASHSIWELVAHLTAELEYARAVIEGTAGAWVEGETTWPAVAEPSEASWKEAVEALKKAHRELLRVVRKLDDDILDTEPVRVGGTFYLMLHGTMQHNVYHSGQISMLTRQMARDELESGP